MPDQFLTIDGRPAIRVERDYPHPIEKVWRAVTTPGHLAQWFPSAVELDLRPGGEMRFGDFAGPQAHGTIEVVEPPRQLTFTWGTDRLSFELTPDGDGTRFVLIHAFDDRYGAASFATGWGTCLTGLGSVLAGEPVPPPEPAVTRHEEIVAEFGLDRPEVSESDDGWAVRMERQLTCPADVAWNLWFGKDRNTGEPREAPAVGEPFTPYLAPDVVATTTELELHRVLAFEVASDGGPGEYVRVEMTEGTGHGARVILTVTGTDPDRRDEAAEVWARQAIGHLAMKAAEWAMARVG